MYRGFEVGLLALRIASSGGQRKLVHPTWKRISRKANTIGNENKEKSVPAQGQPITPPKPEEQEPNAMECAGLFPATRHLLDSWLEELGKQVAPHLPETGAATAVQQSLSL